MIQGSSASSVPIGLTPLTLGIHAHWSGAQGVPGRLDLIKGVKAAVELASRTGLHVCLDCDGIGLERMASDSPRTLALLVEALDAGYLSLTGGSYGMPIALFFGGESAIRQWVWGVRTCLRITGHRPRFFWQAEGGVFPQLAQTLVQCGFQGAAFAYPNGVNSPASPFASGAPAVWMGHDGSRLIVFSSEGFVWPSPATLPHWVPPLAGSHTTPSSDESEGSLPVLKPEASDFWHGLSLPRWVPEWTREVVEEEARLLAWESMAAMLSLWGPLDEPDIHGLTSMAAEAWTSLLAAQNHEVVKQGGAALAWASALKVYSVSLCKDSDMESTFASRGGMASHQKLLVNPRGWDRAYPVEDPEPVPPFGWRATGADLAPPKGWTATAGVWTSQAGGVKAEVDFETRTIWVANTECPEGFQIDIPILQWAEDESLIREEGDPEVEITEADDYDEALLGRTLVARWPHHLIRMTVAPETGGLLLAVSASPDDLDPGFPGAIKVCWKFPEGIEELLCDTPYAVHPARAGAPAVRRYPLGDPGDSPLWSDVAENAFTSHSFVNIRKRRTSLLLAHSPQPQWLIEEGEHRHLIALKDPWHGGDAPITGWTTYCLIPHRALSAAECWQAASAMNRATSTEAEGILTIWKDLDTPAPPHRLLPREFSALRSATPGLSVTAFFREKSEVQGEGLDGYAGRMIQLPFVVRMVEFDGRAGEAQLRVAGTVVKAYKTNVLGEVEHELEPQVVFPAPDDPCTIRGRGSLITFSVRAHEVVTLYLDILEGRPKVEARRFEA